MAYTQEIVHDFESVLAGREIHGCDIRNLLELGGGVLFEEGDDRENTSGRDVDGQFVFPDRELLDVFGQAGHDVLAVIVQRLGLLLVLVGGVNDFSAQFLHSLFDRAQLAMQSINM